jgi:hypothetical protein
MIVATVALIAALTGTAIALPGKNSVESDDIKNRNVRSNDLGKRSVKTTSTNLVRSDTAPGLTQTASGTAIEAGGPSVTVRVPAGALVAVHAQAELRRSGGGGGDNARVHLHEPTVFGASPQIMRNDTTGFEFRYTTPTPGEADGAASQARSGWLVLSNVPAGKRTFSLRYSAEGGTGLFQNRELHVMVIR